MLSRWKKVSPLDFKQYNHFKYYRICLCVRMLVLEWKERAFIEKVNSRCFCWFPAAILVHQNGAPIWRLHTKLYKGAWNVSANNSETVGHKDLRLGQIVYILVFYNIHFLGFFHWTVSNLFLCCVTVKTVCTLNMAVNLLIDRWKEGDGWAEAKRPLNRYLTFYTDLLNVSGTVSASRSREKMFPSTGRVVKRGPGGMFLNS